MDSSGMRRIVTMRKRFGTTKGIIKLESTQIARRIQMQTNESIGTVDYISAPKPGKDQWFMPVVLEGSGTKIKFYCKFDPQVGVGDRVMVSYGQERNGNATAFKVTRPDVDINQDVQPTGGATATPNKSSALPQDMIAVGLAGRITEVIMTLHHEKGVQMKDPVAEVAKWIKIGVDGYKKSTQNIVDEIKESFPGATVDDDDIDDEVPFQKGGNMSDNIYMDIISGYMKHLSDGNIEQGQFCLLLTDLFKLYDRK